jgi:hypothetical protein
MLAAKNSRKRMPARSPAAATSAGNVREAIGTSWLIGCDAKHRFDVSDRRRVAEAMKSRAGLCPVPNLDLARIAIIRERVAPCADCRPKHVCAPASVLLDFDRPWFARPNDAPSKARAIPFTCAA